MDVLKEALIVLTKNEGSSADFETNEIFISVLSTNRN